MDIKKLIKRKTFKIWIYSFYFNFIKHFYLINFLDMLCLVTLISHFNIPRTLVAFIWLPLKIKCFNNCKGSFYFINKFFIQI